MGYQVLARKWRPHSFHDVVGQQHVLTALINALDQGRLHHAYLLSGTRGVGKTTIARILAKCLNCEEGVSSTPCGHCDSCREIDQGNFVDLLEIDAASRTKVEDTRELLDNVQYRPARGRYKVYLIDEVHMLSRHSFNALLKTLEEPPPYVKFLLATTDPQKLPITILSRCLQFHLKALTREQIVSQLVRVLDAEAQPYELPALAALAKAADGSMRDALSLTDQALAHGSGHVHLDQVLAMLGTLDHRHLHQILLLLAQLQGPALMAKVNEVAQLGPDFELLHAELASLLHRIALAQLLGGSADPLALDSEQVVALAQTFTAEEIQLYYQIALTGRRELPLAPDGRSGFEMTLLRMLAFSPRKAADNARLTAMPVAMTGGDISASFAIPQATPTGSAARAPDPRPGVSQAALRASESALESLVAETRIDMAEVEEDVATMAAQEALFAEQQRLQDEAASWQSAPSSAARFSESSTLVPAPVTGAGNPADAGLNQLSSPADGGLNQLLQVRNRLRSQQKEPVRSDTPAAGNRSPAAYSPPVARPVPARPAPVARPATEPAVDAAAAPSSRPVAEPTAAIRPVAAPSVLDDRPPWEAPAQKPPRQDALAAEIPAWQSPPIEAYQDDGGASHLMPMAYESAPELATTASAAVVQPSSAAPMATGSRNVPRAAPVSPVLPLPAAGSEASEPLDPRWLSNDLLTGCGEPWAELIAASGLGGRLRQLALQASRQVDGDNWLLTLPAEHRHLVSDKAITALVEGFSRHLQQPVQIQIEVGVPTQRTPIQIEQQRYAELLVAAQQDLAQDPHIQFLIQRFGAQLDADSILPLKH